MNNIKYQSRRAPRRCADPSFSFPPQPQRLGDVAWKSPLTLYRQARLFFFPLIFFHSLLAAAAGNNWEKELHDVVVGLIRACALFLFLLEISQDTKSSITSRRPLIPSKFEPLFFLFLPLLF